MAVDDNSAQLIAWFAAEGISADRLKFHRRSGMAAYLIIHQPVDFCLDTFHYTGGTTTMHALWMGVPTLTSALARRCAHHPARALQPLRLRPAPAGRRCSSGDPTHHVATLVQWRIRADYQSKRTRQSPVANQKQIHELLNQTTANLCQAAAAAAVGRVHALSGATRS